MPLHTQGKTNIFIISFVVGLAVILLAVIINVIFVFGFPLKFDVFPPVASCIEDDQGLDRDRFGVCRDRLDTIEDTCIVGSGATEILQVESYCFESSCSTETKPCPSGTRCNGGVCVEIISTGTYAASISYTGEACHPFLDERILDV